LSRIRLAVGLLLTVLLCGCSVPVASGLNDHDANQVIAALQDTGITSSKEPDPTTEGSFRVMVERDEVPLAIQTLRNEQLPAKHSPGVLEAVGKSSLVPSSLAEHAQYTTGLAGDLEHSLASIPGVVQARVHLSLPAPSPLFDGPKKPSSASVLLSFHGTKPPLEEQEIRRLVAGAVGELKPEQINVIMVPRHGNTKQTAWSRVGPFTVAQRSVWKLRLLLGGSMLFNVLMAPMLIWFWRNTRRRTAAAKKI
jgi:type III secretion protein J